VDCGGGEGEDACTQCHDPVIQRDLAPFQQTGVREDQKRFFFIFFYLFGGLECFGHSFAYGAHYYF
jgi:hypothetical protein